MSGQGSLIVDSLPYFLVLLVIWGSVASSILAIQRLIVPIYKRLRELFWIAEYEFQANDGHSMRDEVSYLSKTMPQAASTAARAEGKIDRHLMSHREYQDAPKG